MFITKSSIKITLLKQKKVDCECEWISQIFGIQVTTTDFGIVSPLSFMHITYSQLYNYCYHCEYWICITTEPYIHHTICLTTHESIWLMHRNRTVHRFNTSLVTKLTGQYITDYTTVSNMEIKCQFILGAKLEALSKDQKSQTLPWWSEDKGLELRS